MRLPALVQKARWHKVCYLCRSEVRGSDDARVLEAAVAAQCHRPVSFKNRDFLEPASRAFVAGNGAHCLVSSGNRASAVSKDGLFCLARVIYRRRFQRWFSWQEVASSSTVMAGPDKTTRDAGGHLRSGARQSQEVPALALQDITVLDMTDGSLQPDQTVFVEGDYSVTQTSTRFGNGRL